MINEIEELKVRARGETQELATLLQAVLDRNIALAGENAVLKMKLEAAKESKEAAN